MRAFVGAGIRTARAGGGGGDGVEASGAAEETNAGEVRTVGEAGIGVNRGSVAAVVSRTGVAWEGEGVSATTGKGGASVATGGGGVSAWLEVIGVTYWCGK